MQAQRMMGQDPQQDMQDNDEPTEQEVARLKKATAVSKISPSMMKQLNSVSKQQQDNAKYILMMRTAAQQKKVTDRRRQEIAQRTEAIKTLMRQGRYSDAANNYATLFSDIALNSRINPAMTQFAFGTKQILNYIKSGGSPEVLDTINKLANNDRSAITFVLDIIMANKQVSGAARQKLADLYEGMKQSNRLSVNRILAEALSKNIPQPAGIQNAQQISIFDPKQSHLLLDPRKYAKVDKNYYSIVNKNKPTADQLALSTPYYNSQQIPVKGDLSAFPQWMMSRQKQHQQRAVFSKESIQQMKLDPQNQMFKDLNIANKSLAKWDAGAKVWKGKTIKKLQNKSFDPQRFAVRYNQGRAILGTKLSQQQVVSQVPVVVQDIIGANTALSSNGFGPVKPGGLALYAGRWVDSATGHVRILPNASTKYINPVSAPQRLGYLQARILNHWNNLVRTAQQYNQLQQNTDKWQLAKTKTIQSSLDPQKYNDISTKSINNAIDSWYQSNLLTKGQKKLLPPMQRAKDVLLRGFSDRLLAIKRKKNANLKKTMWRDNLTSSYDRTLALIKNRDIPEQSKLKLYSQFTAAYLSLSDPVTRKVKAALKQIVKVRAIPQKLTQLNISSTMEAVQGGQSRVNNIFTSNRLVPAETRLFVEGLRNTLLGSTQAERVNNIRPGAQGSNIVREQMKKWDSQNVPEYMQGVLDNNPWSTYAQKTAQNPFLRDNLIGKLKGFYDTNQVEDNDGQFAYLGGKDAGQTLFNQLYNPPPFASDVASRQAVDDALNGGAARDIAAEDRIMRQRQAREAVQNGQKLADAIMM